MAATKMGIGKNFIRPSLMPDKTYEEVKWNYFYSPM